MRDRDVAFKEMAKSNKATVNILRVVGLIFALMLVQIACTPPAAETCPAGIKAARTVAKLEPAIVECFKMKLSIESVRAELEKKAAHLMNNQREIPVFMSELPPDTEKEEEPFPHETLVSVIMSIERRGVIRPYIGFIELSLKPNGEANWLVLGISDQPI